MVTVLRCGRRRVKSGVPQGKVMFLVYVNNVIDTVRLDSTLNMFADDVKILRPIQSRRVLREAPRRYE